MPRASQTPKEPAASPAPNITPTQGVVSRSPFSDKKKIREFVVFGVLVVMVFLVLISYWSARSYRQTSLGLPSTDTVTSGIARMDSFTNPMMAPNIGITQKSYGAAGNVAGSAEGYEIILPPSPPEPGAEPSTPMVPAERKIIKNGNLALLVKDVERTAQSIQGIAQSLGGFVEGTSFNEYVRGTMTGYMTIRVPGEQFDSAMASVKGLAIRVENESSNAQDVSAQYVDLTAQLKNYRAEETQYQEIMAKAQKIDDVLNVASRLADVRGRIERTQGQLNLLSRQVAMSTITVTLTPEASAREETNQWRPWTVAKEAFRGVVASLIASANVLIAFLVYLPIILLRIAFYALIIWTLWRLAKWGYEKLSGKPLPPIRGGI